MQDGRGTALPERGIRKVRTGITGFDDVTGGGLPAERTTLICGGAGSGKTVFGIEFLVRGAVQFGEPGVLVAFEETASEVAANVASLGFDLDDLIERRLLVIDHLAVPRDTMAETGEYSLEGLFVRLGAAVQAVGAKRVVLDSLETLFASLGDTHILRAELRRLFHWLKDIGVTSVITAERGDGGLTRQGIEEYVSDCVVLLDHRVAGQLATRRLRIVKYRGSAHSADEIPFLIGRSGISVLPVATLGLDHVASTERVSSGVARLDAMLDGHGYFRGTSVLVSGTAGTGKTSLGAHLVNAACERGERAIIFQFEESTSQMVRNLRSIGIDLARWIDAGLLKIVASRPTLYGLEAHLVVIQQEIEAHDPTVVVLDPITNFLAVGTASESRGMLTRLVDYLKLRGVTALYTSLIQAGQPDESSETGISSLMDSWLLVREIESSGERNRILFVLKSRGMAHSNQIREFRLTASGIDLVDPYVGTGGVLTGSARLAQEAREAVEEAVRAEDHARRLREIRRKQDILKAEIEALGEEAGGLASAELGRLRTAEGDRVSMARSRADSQRTSIQEGGA